MLACRPILVLLAAMASGCVVDDPSYLGPPTGKATGVGSGTRTGGPATSTSSVSMTSVASEATADGTSSDSKGGTETSESSSSTTAGVPDGVLLWTTLNDAAAVVEPVVGDSTEASVSVAATSDFVSTPWGGGFAVDAAGDWVRYRQVAGVANIEFDRGTIEFWYRPDYDHVDGMLHRLFSTHESVSGIRARKNANGRFVVLLVDQRGVEHITAVDPSDYGWSAGQWVLVRTTWETGSDGSQAVRVYFDGDEVRRYVSIAGADVTMGPEEVGGWLYLGARSDTASEVANGIIDEFYVYDEVRVP